MDIKTLLFSSEDFTASKSIKVEKRNQDNVYTHNHDFFEIVYVLKGSATQNLNDQSVKISEGNYFIVDYGSYHNYTECKDFQIINCLFESDFIDKTLIGCKSFSQLITNYLIRFNYTILNRIPVNNVFSDTDGTIRRLFENLFFEHETKKPGHVELMRCYLIEILVLTMRNIAKSDKLYNAHRATREIIDYIDAHFFENIKLGDLCKKLNFTLPYISKRFKADTSMTFNMFLQKVRVEQSCRLLAETNEPVSSVAHAVGYEDLKFFGKIFKQHMNMSPSQFRRLTKLS